MVGKSLVFTAVLAATIAAGMAISPGLRAQGQQEKTTPLLKTALAGMADKQVTIVHISAPPGFITPKHFHPGQVFIYVLKGAITIKMEGEAPIKLGPGDILEEAPNRNMVGQNLSTTHGAELIVFLISDKGKPLTVNVK